MEGATSLSLGEKRLGVPSFPDRVGIFRCEIASKSDRNKPTENPVSIQSWRFPELKRGKFQTFAEVLLHATETIHQDQRTYLFGN